MRIRALGVLVLLVAALAACGRDDEAAARSAISDSIVGSDQDFAMSREQADCVAEGLVDRIGVEQLQADGVLTRDLESGGGLGQVEMPAADADVAAEVMAGCTDLREIFTSALPELPEESRRCLDEELTDEVLRDYVAAIFRNEREQGEQRLAEELRDCVRIGG